MRKTDQSAMQEVIRSQLTLRAVIWDISETNTDKLEKELEFYQVYKLMLETAEGMDNKEKYEKAVDRLMRIGVSCQEALLVTEDAGLAEYVHRLRDEQIEQIASQNAENGKVSVVKKGMGVVYYEKEGSRKDISADMIVLGFEEIGVQFLDRMQKRRNKHPWNILYTERTCVREITIEDLDELYVLYEGDGITDYTEPLYERQKEEEYTRSYIDYMYYYYGYGMWVVRDRKTGSLIGRAGIEHREVEGEICMELGYIIGTQYQNKGYATEVCQAIIDYARQELEIKELHCFIHPNNKRSIHLAEKLGFVPYTDLDAKPNELLHFKKV